jgi:N6-L-threonylcarbamoyladenine synthase
MGKILAIESTCDETAVAIVEDGKRILSNITSLQIDIHAPFGGVVPELAARRHLELLRPTLNKALSEAKTLPSELVAVAVAHGPGLLGPLLVGMNFAKSLCLSWEVPLIGVNHIEAHLYSAMMSEGFDERRHLPALGLVLSGGHTSLVEIEKVGSYKLIGQTRDDAIGEAFDKVAKLLGLPYPGGPEVEKKAREGSFDTYPFKAPKIKEAPYDFSFSGLKTSVMQTLKNRTEPLDEACKKDICASFQKAAFESIQDKVTSLTNEKSYHSLLFGGGVTMNEELRSSIQAMDLKIPAFFPPKELCLDNAAMIAGLAFHKLEDSSSKLALDASPSVRMPFSS